MRTGSPRFPRIALLVVLLGVVPRLVWPLSDPPPRLSWSSGVYSDPASKTLPARYAVERGTWTLEESPYLAAFPLSNGLAWIAYRFGGVGRLPYQLAIALVSMLGLGAIVVAVSRTSGEDAALLAAVLGASSYWLAMFARVPVAENIVATLLALTCVVALGSGRGSWLASGALGVGTVLFAKYHAIGFLPGLLLFAGLRGGRRALAFVFAGGTIAFLVWAAAIFRPHHGQILAYVARESTGVHGAFPVTESPWAGLLDVFRSIRAAWIFHQAPVLGIVGVVAVLLGISSRRRFRARASDGSAIFVFWFLGMWLYYALLSYKAPRYYVVVGPALVACTAALLAEAWRTVRVEWTPAVRGRGALRLAAITFPLAWIGADTLRQFLSVVQLHERTRHPVEPSALFELLSPLSDALTSAEAGLRIALVVTAVVVVAALAGGRLASRAPRFRTNGQHLALALVVVALAFDGLQYGWWAAHRKYVVDEIGRALPLLVGDEAVVLGTLAPLVTQRSGVTALSNLHYGEGANALDRYAVTHLLVDDRSRHSALFTQDANLEARLLPLLTWRLQTRAVERIDLYRISGSTVSATLFERAVAAMDRAEWGGALELLRSHRRAIGRDLVEVAMREARCHGQLGDVESVRAALARAQSLAPRNAQVHEALGRIARLDGNAELARRHWMRGLALEPHNRAFAQLLRQLD